MTLLSVEENLNIDRDDQQLNAKHDINDPQLPQADTDLSLSPVDDLKVSLSFQVGSLELPLKELKHISMGYSFDLKKRLTDQPVSILANGLLFATGELVCIGDFIGVRITRLPAQSCE